MGSIPLQRFANTLEGHRSGLLAWYGHRISTGRLEGVNNKNQNDETPSLRLPRPGVLQIANPWNSRNYVGLADKPPKPGYVV